MDQAATGKTFVCFLTYGSRTANRTDSPFQTVNGLVGNVDWGECLSVVTCDFPGLNSSGTRRRAASEWLAVETYFSQDYPTSRRFEACNLTQVLTGFGYTFEVRKHVLTLRCSLVRLGSFTCAHGWCNFKSAQPFSGMES